MLGILVRVVLERDMYVCSLWEKTSSQSSNPCSFCLFGDSLCAICFPPLSQEANCLPYQLVVKSGRALCGHPLNETTVVGTGEMMKTGQAGATEALPAHQFRLPSFEGQFVNHPSKTGLGPVVNEGTLATQQMSVM